MRQAVRRARIHHYSNVSTLDQNTLVYYSNGLNTKLANDTIATLSRTTYGSRILLARNTKLLAISELSRDEST
jgi:hypothetical protein